VSSASRSRAELARELPRVLLDATEAAKLEVHGRTDAAVLVPLFVDTAGELHAVFTRRRDDLRRHAGEISFPGGRQDPEDDDLLHTALREAHEEIGLDPAAVTIEGALPPTPTFVTNYAIYPFVGRIAAGTAWTLQPDEVDRVLELSLSDIRRGYGRRRLVRRGVAFRTDTYLIGEDLIWGATARIVADLLERV
jgi:8-oxo-dGTP pyrophosphatase MutT (NUDIX family)